MPRPFTADDYEERMRRAAEAGAAAGLAGLVITPGPDLVYLTGYRPVAITERITALVLVPGREPALLMPKLERPDVERSAAAGRLRLSDWIDGDDPYAALAPLLPDPAGRYGIADTAWSLHLLGLQEALPDSRYSALTQALPMMRAVKDTAELERLAAAGQAADDTYLEILKVPFAGRLETEVAADLAAGLTRRGHSQVDFTVVGSGPNGANPHHEAGDRRIEDGDTVVLDFGGLMDGYGSDTTRTVHVGPDVPAQVREVHDVVRLAQQTAFEAVRPGVACQEIDRAARKVITDAGYGEYFIHRTGHGIGTTTHEPPYMVEGETRELVPGMCFSIEPGIYLPGRFGVRIEDIVTVTETGGRRLNNSPHELGTVG
ncbi:aminopeptidase P family protein [Catenulispora yoronensis]|uniref:Aminopeptidase P family protein n=1 Tax=Catenulispora yoronensis TaxID=450799 RepID=A0ABN2TZA4_9ACTN